MSEEMFQEGQEAYSVKVDYNGKIEWTVYRVLKVLPKSLKLQRNYWRSQLIRQKQSGEFCCYSDAVIKPSRESALRSAIEKVKARHKQYVKIVDRCAEHLTLLEDEIDKEGKVKDE